MATSEPRIEAVVFDLGKVLVDFDYSIALRKIAARSKLRYEEFPQSFTQTPLLLRYETGLLTSEQFFQEVCAVTGFCGNLDEFAASFGDIFSPMQPMIEVHRTLRQQGLRSFIFSNTNELAIRHIRNSFPFFSNFDGYVFSYEHGAMKPDPALYAVVEQQSGRSGPQILYLDDRPENVEAGLARGWRGIVHETAEKSVAAMRELGLKVISSGDCPAVY